VPNVLRFLHQIEGRMTDAPTRYWLYAAIAGLFMLLLFAAMAAIMPAPAATMPKSYGGPVLALEFARILPDVKAILGTTDDPAHIARISMLQLGTYQDMAFAPLYALFLSFAALALLRVTEWRALYAVPFFAGLACCFDWLENYFLLDVLDAYRTGGLSPWLAKLGWPVAIKFLSIGLVGSLIGIGLAALEGAWKWIGYAIAGLSFPLTLIALFVPFWLAGAMAAGVGISWLILFGTSIWGSIVWFRNR
jgi:hypothetical protein